MKLRLMTAALCAAGLAACGTENAVESKAKVPPQPIAAAPAPQVQAQAEQARQYMPVYEKYPAPKTESNMGEKEPLDPSEQEKH